MRVDVYMQGGAELSGGGSGRSGAAHACTCCCCMCMSLLFFCCVPRLTLPVSHSLCTVGRKGRMQCRARAAVVGGQHSARRRFFGAHARLARIERRGAPTFPARTLIVRAEALVFKLPYRQRKRT